MARNMLIISAGEWVGINHRPHHFARRAANSGWRVVYVEPPASIIAPLKSGKTRQRMLKRWSNWRQGVRVTEENITLIAPPPILPFGNRYRWINKLNQRLTLKSIRKQLRVGGSDLYTMATADGLGRTNEQTPTDLYTYLPSAVDLLALFKFDQVIYDCVDDHAAFTGTHSAETLANMERELCERADLCLATATKLLEDRIQWNPNFQLVPNGVEYSRFAVAAESAGADDKPTDTASISAADTPASSTPTIGFVGGISDWINIELIAGTAALLPNYKFKLIGPIDTDVTVLENQPNIDLLGPKPYEDLPGYLRTFDVCLITFRINQLSASVNPIKMYEYLAAGKPVVATPMPEVVRFATDNLGSISIAATAGETAAAIETYIAAQRATDPASRQARIAAIAARQELAAQNSWDSRWSKIVELLESR